MPQLSVIVNKIKFVIKSDDGNLIKEQLKLLYNNITPSNQTVEDTIIINYNKDKATFEKVKKILSTQNLESIDTFKREKHYKGFVDGLPAFKKDNSEYYVLTSAKLNEFWLIANPDVDTSVFPTRLITEILIRKMEEKGAVLSHATGVTLEDIGLFLTSSAGGGKTTMMTKIIESGKDVGFLSNDRLFSYFKGSKAIMDYVPFQVNYEKETIYGSSVLPEYFKNSPISTQERLDKIGKASINLTDMTKAYPFLKMKSFADIDKIIIPQINLDNNKGYEFCVETIRRKKLREILQENTFTPYDAESPRQPWLYPRQKSEKELKEQAADFVDKLVDVPAYKITYKPQAKSDEIAKAILNMEY